MASQTRSVDNTVSSQWTNPNNAFSENDSCTETSSDGDQNIYNFTGTPFSLPAGATIDGIEVKTIRGGDSDDIYEIELYDSVSAWRLISGTANNATCAGGAQETLGSPSNDWGGTWTQAHINSSSFQVRLTFTKSAKANTMYVDHIEVTVHYTVLTTYTEEWAVDALFQRLGFTEDFDIDAAFQREVTEAFDVDAAFRAEFSEAFGVDAAFLRELTSSFDIDSVYSLAGITETFDVDSVFQLSDITESFAVDSLFVRMVIAAFGIDAVFGESGLVARLRPFLIDAIFKRVATLGFSLDVIFGTWPGSVITLEFHKRGVGLELRKRGVDLEWKKREIELSVMP